MPFLDRFEIRAIVSSICLRARDKVTGLNVLVHAVPADPADPELERLLERSGLFVTAGDQETTRYIATPDRHELLDLAVWKGRQSPVTKAMSGRPNKPDQAIMFRIPPKVDPPAQQHAPSEFTQMFQTAPVPPAAAAPAPLSVPPPHAAPPAAEGFTQMFQTLETPPPPPAPVADEFEAMFQAAPPKPAPDDQLTQLLDTAPPSTPPVVTPPRPLSPPPSEFTSMFQTPQAHSPAPPPVVPPPVAPPQAAQAPGEFTSMFKAPAQPTTPLPPPPPVAAPQAAQEPDEFASMFQIPAPPPVPPPVAAQPATPPPPPPAKPPQAAQAPGEFTSMFRSTPQPPPPPPPAPPAASSEFTSMFQSPPVPSGSPAIDPEKTQMFTPPAAPAAPPQQPQRPTSPPRPPGPGEFTRMFQNAPTPTPLPTSNDPFANSGYPPEPPKQMGEFESFFNAPYTANPNVEAQLRNPNPAPQPYQQQPPAREAGDFTRLFGTKAPSPQSNPNLGATGAFSAPAPPQPAPELAPPVASGPSEYTRIFSRPQSDAAPPPAAPAVAKKPTAAKVDKPSKFSVTVLFWVALALLAIIAIGTVIYFVTASK